MLPAGASMLLRNDGTFLPSTLAVHLGRVWPNFVQEMLPDLCMLPVQTAHDEKQWKCTKELETDKKTQIPALFKLSKTQKAEVIVAALGCWLPRVESGEVPQLGHQVPEPLEPKEKIVELEEEKNDAGYEDQD
ncbi:hypothetical protein B0H10DRAFT_1950479 [Mycena sp. CBHHK59/15]|nr:hypothetical protein B0H10DRAFT_1950479 [Mycena sp. CBHHK59/15]